MTSSNELAFEWIEDGGEPMITAIRSLAALEQHGALVGLLCMLPPNLAEARAETYRGLAGVPGRALAPLLASSSQATQGLDRDGRTTDDDVALLGLVDLLVDHQADDELLPVLKELADRDISLDLYQYLVSAVVARRRPPLIRTLLDHAATEMRRERLDVLADSLELVPGAEADAAQAEIRERLAARAAPAIRGAKGPAPRADLL